MDVKNLTVLKGDAKISDGRIMLDFVNTTQEKEVTDRTKETKDVKKQAKEVTTCEVRSDVIFTNGSLELTFKTNHIDSGILWILQTQDGSGATAGLSNTFKSFLFGDAISHFKPIIEAGGLKNYPLNESLRMRLDVFGSYAKLFVNNILMVETTINSKQAPLQIRASTKGHLEIYDLKASPIKPKIFIVMQFSKEYNELYEDVIKPVVEEFGYEAVRADEFYTAAPILKDIIESIEQSIAIIAEITPDNPNVFYEIGYSHAIKKPTILLCDRNREKLPFDISSFRTLFYENTIAGKRKVESSLKKYLQNIK
ncbi:hypothetical protein [Segetibacter aerophilus]|uniref:Uncharacterized protein n=1 Tax=Segetibacter aerophilus TaxID=670293 RepID=A0A512BIA7_9BACT|nr:hypothetical protein [Segetibacter aerophilus]GEO11557.1 hypothetical protein SAE01_40530 [Segetibacter aerophilus]